MAVRYTMWSRDDAAAAKIAKALATNDTHSVLVRAFIGIVLDKKIPTAERERVEERKRATTVTIRLRTFWHQLSAEVRSYVGEDAIDDVRNAVELGLFDVTWMDGCPLLENVRKHPEFPELRERVALRARAALMQLHGAEATLAS
jgi:hypothetical protein